MPVRSSVSPRRADRPGPPTSTFPLPGRPVARRSPDDIPRGPGIGRPAPSGRPTGVPGHALSRIPVQPGPPVAAAVTAPPSAAAPIQLGKSTKIEVGKSKARFARRWQAAHNSRKNLATLKLRHRKSKKVLYLNAESLGMGYKSFTNPRETFRTKAGTLKRRKHSEPQLLLAWQNQMLQKGKKTFDLKDYDREWAFSTNEACGSDGEGCGSEVVPSLTPDKMPFYYQNPYSGSSQSGGFGSSYNKHYMKNEDSETESEAEDDIEDVLMISPSQMRGKDFSTTDTVPVEDMKTFITKGRHWKKRRSKRYQDRGFGY